MCVSGLQEVGGMPGAGPEPAGVAPSWLPPCGRVSHSEAGTTQNPQWERGAVSVCGEKIKLICPFPGLDMSL